MQLYAGLIKSTLIDYPNKIAAVLFFAGCSYDCFYCHNRDLIKAKANTLALEDAYSFLEKRKGLLEGVVLSGGEASSYKGLPSVMMRIKEMGYQIKLDTNGYSKKRIEELLDLNLIDYIALDIKAPIKRYKEIAGFLSDGNQVKEVFNLIKERNIDYMTRTTVCPTLDLEDLKIIAKEYPIFKKWRLQVYNKPPLYRECEEERVNKKAPVLFELEEWARQLRELQPNVEV